MHEMSIAVQIIDHAVQVAGQNNATRIDEVEVQVGVMRQVVPEALEFAFSVAAEGTLAEWARLRLIEEKATAVCNACRHTFVPDVEWSFLCPQCQRADARIVAGNDIILKSLVCQVDEEVPAP